jgi:hypothetical protein
MLRTGINPWGRENGMEAQRSDLWLLDFSSVISGIKDQAFVLEALGLSESDLPTQDDVAYYPQRISPPALRTRLRQIVHGTVPVQQPGYSEAIDSVRIEFLHDVRNRGRMSRILSMIMAWQQLSRIGRRSTHGIYIPFPSAVYRPRFRFDVVIRLVQGDVNGVSREMEPGAAYVLEKCWIKSYQSNELSMADSASHRVVADLQPQNIRPWDLTTNSQ